MVLVADVGNTNIKFGIYDNDKIVLRLRCSTTRNKTPDEFSSDLYTFFEIHKFDYTKIDGAIICSVVPAVTTNLKTAIDSLINKDTLVVGPGVKSGLNIKIDHPETLGADIVAGCVAASELFGFPNIVIFMGTATAIVYVDEKNNYCGGTISPGVNIAHEALTKSGALLSAVDLELPDKLIGTNTHDSIKSGVVWGNICMVDGLLDKFKKEKGDNCKIIATGGLASLVAKHCNNDIILCDDLILEGLRIIYKKNQK